MILGMSYYQICWYFLIYSFGGWIIEVIFHAVTVGKVINRGFLNGPVCPVYGFGVLSVFAAVNSMQLAGTQANDLEIFIFGVALATAVELIAGFLLDKMFHARWWDYSKRPFNLHGYICLEFSLIWGLAILLVVRVFQYYVENHAVANIETGYGWILLAIFYITDLAGFIVTVMVINGFNKRLKKLDKIQSDMRIISDGLSEKLATQTIKTAQMVDESRIQAALAKAELKDSMVTRREEMTDALAEMKAMTTEEQAKQREALKKDFDELAAKLTKRKLYGPGHILSAFPEMKHRKYPEIIEALKERQKK